MSQETNPLSERLDPETRSDFNMVLTTAIRVQVFIEPLSRSRAVISDKGRTLNRLQEQSENFEAGQTGALLEERLKTFELQRDGFELLREIRLPPDGLDVQLFCGLAMKCASCSARISRPKHCTVFLRRQATAVKR